MKSPRKILLEQHQAATPKLDAVRNSVINAELRGAEISPNWGVLCWRELIFPCRRIWTGLAAVWVLLFIVNFSQRDNLSGVTGKTARSGEVSMSLQAQQRWMNELLADRSAPPEADHPRNLTPKPRTEKSETATV